MSIEDPDSIAQAIRERFSRYQPYLRDQKRRKLADTSFLKSPRGNWVNEKRLRDEVSSEKELNYNFNDDAHEDDDDDVENESIRVTVHDPPTSDRNEGGEVQDISKDEEVDKEKILLEENVEVDGDKFRKLEERMYNE
ncbi:hypothetical protein QAD02_013492 [Eretmocerus hayati]|uniref:Uncharacterized protein n=1 Tax=Eretmocerus hayati TaxID=131215 RepID=A0ACC2P2R9_9HYME|nr:hypothetical protein QAD02_013492 [Eretmocerus hayati]